MSRVQIDTQNSELVAENIPLIFRTRCIQFIQIHTGITPHMHSVAEECCPLWLFEWFSLKLER